MPIIGIHSSPTESETLGVEPRNVCFSKLMFPDGSDGKRICLQCRRPGFISWVGKIPWRSEWLPTPVSLDLLVAQLVKNLPAVQETWVRSLGWEDPLEKGMATHSSILARRIPWTV